MGHPKFLLEWKASQRCFSVKTSASAYQRAFPGERPSRKWRSAVGKVWKVWKQDANRWNAWVKPGLGTRGWILWSSPTGIARFTSFEEARAWVEQTYTLAMLESVP